MSDDFIRYVGGPQFHDATIIRVAIEEREVEVQVRCEENRLFTARFFNVDELDLKRPIGMFLYAIAELGTRGMRSRFCFVNWNEKDDASLELTADSVQIEPR